MVSTLNNEDASTSSLSSMPLATSVCLEILWITNPENPILVLILPTVSKHSFDRFNSLLECGKKKSCFSFFIWKSGFGFLHRNAPDDLKITFKLVLEFSFHSKSLKH